ncbi:MAG: DUF3489 domain-containing protein [Rhodocyclaceae bacterium]|nr:DUF3489 domain-containing protein [Rhodocyclaceae bacterium]
MKPNRRHLEFIERAAEGDGRIDDIIDLKGRARRLLIESLARQGLIEPADDGWRVTPQARELIGKPAPVQTSRPASKLALIVERLRTGTTVAELSQATGWKAHSIRAALCHTLPKRGLRIVAEKAPGNRQKRYRLVEESV